MNYRNISPRPLPSASISLWKICIHMSVLVVPLFYPIARLMLIAQYFMLAHPLLPHCTVFLPRSSLCLLLFWSCSGCYRKIPLSHQPPTTFLYKWKENVMTSVSPLLGVSYSTEVFFTVDYFHALHERFWNRGEHIFAQCTSVKIPDPLSLEVDDNSEVLNLAVIELPRAPTLSYFGYSKLLVVEIYETFWRLLESEDQEWQFTQRREDYIMIQMQVTV